MRFSLTSLVASISLLTVFACGGDDKPDSSGNASGNAGTGGSARPNSGGSANSSGGTNSQSAGGSSAGNPASGGTSNTAGAGGGSASGGSAGQNNCPSGKAGSPGGDACGGILAVQCKPGYACIDDPSDDCDPKCGGSDCDGVCVPAATPRCGGFAGLRCPEGTRCLDDVSDDCTPGGGSADCLGICIGSELAPTCQGGKCEGELVCAHSNAACAEDRVCEWCAPNPKIGISCDRSEITCKRAEPRCPAGFVVSVAGSCFGPCVPIGLCRCDAETACPADAACSFEGRCAATQ